MTESVGSYGAQLAVEPPDIRTCSVCIGGSNTWRGIADGTARTIFEIGDASGRVTVCGAKALKAWCCDPHALIPGRCQSANRCTTKARRSKNFVPSCLCGASVCGLAHRSGLATVAETVRSVRLTTPVPRVTDFAVVLRRGWESVERGRPGISAAYQTLASGPQVPG